MLAWIGGLRGNGHVPSFVPLIIWQARRCEACQCHTWHKCLLGWRIRLRRVCSVSFHAVHMLSMIRPTVFLSMPPFATVSAVTFESQSFLFLCVPALSVSFLLAHAFALATFALTLARRCIHVRWCWSTLILSHFRPSAKDASMAARTVTCCVKVCVD